MVSSYFLPDECWEFIFKFIIHDDYNNRHDSSLVTKKFLYLNSLSLVSKQFLSITNRLRFSLTLDCELIFDYKLTVLHSFFERFTNLNSLNLTWCCINHDNLLIEISRFPLKKLASLNLSYQDTIPAIGLRAFSQKIITLTSLTCSNMNSPLSTSDLFLIAECFPLLQELDLRNLSDCKSSSSYVDGVEALSLALINLRKVDLSGIPINNQSLFYLCNNCKHLEEIMFKCDGHITDVGSSLRKRPTLRSLSFSTMNDTEVFATSHFIDSLVSLKSLTCLVLKGLNISDELLYSIAREGLPLTSLDLQFCTNFSYNGIFCLLSKCRSFQHLGLQSAYFLNYKHVEQLSLFLSNLVSINLSDCDELTESALFALAKNCLSLSEIKMERIRSMVIGNSDSSGKFGVNPQLKYLYLGWNSWLTDESIIMIASIFPNLQLLDLRFCNHISEGICQVLRKCCKIRHLNLANCSNMKLLGLNFVVPMLEVLDLSDTKVDDKTLNMISKNCCGLLLLLLEYCDCVTEKGVKHLVENCTQLKVVGYPIH